VQLVMASNFFWTKRFITELVGKISDVNVSVISKILRQRLVGSNIESLRCTKVNDNTVSVRITLRNAVAVFQVNTNGKEG